MASNWDDLMANLGGLFGGGEEMPRASFGSTNDAPSMAPVFAGVSDDEERKAQAKLMDAQASAMAKKAEMEQRQQDELASRLEMLQGRSKADNVFVAKGNKSMGKSDNSDSGAGYQREWQSAGGGNFSKSDAPIVEQTAVKRLVSQGMEPSRAQAIVDSAGVQGAEKMMFQKATSSNGPSLKDLLDGAGSSKDIAGYMALLERLGILQPQKK